MDLAIGVAGLEIIIWRLNRFGPHRVLQGHADWVECVVIAYRKPSKTEDDQEQKKEVAPKHVKFTGPKEDPAKPLARPVVIVQPGSLFDTEIYSAGADGSILKWRPSASNCDSWTLHEYSSPSGSPILCMTYDQGLDVLITGSEDCKVRIWNLDKQPSPGNGPDVLRGHEDKVVGVCVHHELLITASYDKSLKWWNLPLRIPGNSIEMAHDLPIEDMGYSPLRGELATCGGGAFFKIWNASKKKFVQTFFGGSGNIITIKWCNLLGGFWITASDAGEIAFWDPETGLQTKSMSLKKEPVTSLFVDEFNELVLMSMLSDHLVRGYDMQLNREMCTYIGHTDQIHSIIYFPQRRQYISGAWDNTLRSWLVPDEMSEAKPVRLKTAGEEEAKELDPLYEEAFVSTYEKEYPLIPPKTLQSMGPAIQGKRPESRDSSTIPPTSLLSPDDTVSSTASSNESRRSNLQLSKRLEDMETILRP